MMPTCHEDFVLNTKNFQALRIFTMHCLMIFRMLNRLEVLFVSVTGSIKLNSLAGRRGDGRRESVSRKTT